MTVIIKKKKPQQFREFRGKKPALETHDQRVYKITELEISPTLES